LTTPEWQRFSIQLFIYFINNSYPKSVLTSKKTGIRKEKWLDFRLAIGFKLHPYNVVLSGIAIGYEANLSQTRLTLVNMAYTSPIFLTILVVY
jgi:hypothetical protein